MDWVGFIPESGHSAPNFANIFHGDPLTMDIPSIPCIASRLKGVWRRLVMCGIINLFFWRHRS